LKGGEEREDEEEKEEEDEDKEREEGKISEGISFDNESNCLLGVLYNEKIFFIRFYYGMRG